MCGSLCGSFPAKAGQSVVIDTLGSILQSIVDNDVKPLIMESTTLCMNICVTNQFFQSHPTKSADVYKESGRLFTAQRQPRISEYAEEKRTIYVCTVVNVKLK